MAEPAHEPGWYPDPWQRAAQRWHDGRRWTEHVDGDPTGGATSGTSGTAGATATAAGAAAPTITPQAALIEALAAHPVERSTSSGRATAALVTGLLGVPLVPILLGVLALHEISQASHHMKGAVQAWLGILFGVVGIVVLALLTFVAIPAALRQVEQFGGPGGLPSPTAALGAASAARAQGQLRLVATAMEACAATSDTGSYLGCDAQVAQTAPELGRAMAACGTPGGICLTVTDASSWQARVTDTASTPTTWTETHHAGGRIVPSCSGPACNAIEAFA